MFVSTGKVRADDQEKIPVGAADGARAMQRGNERREGCANTNLFAHKVKAATPMTPAILEMAFVHPPPRLIMLPFT